MAEKPDLLHSKATGPIRSRSVMDCHQSGMIPAHPSDEDKSCGEIPVE